METKYYDISGFNIPFVCKVSTFYNPYVKYTHTNIMIDGPGRHHARISIDDIEPTIAYIANVDYSHKCSKSHKLELHKGTCRLVKTALWVTRLLYPGVRTFTLHDNSHIYHANGSKEYKADLASDYIFKYNETWYEKNFSARLPEPIYNYYKATIPTLDAPLQPISEPYLNEFADIYSASSTPRDFINNMRTKWKRAYCIKVGPWLHNYLESLYVDMIDRYKTEWVINADDVHEVPGFTMKDAPEYEKNGYIFNCDRIPTKYRTHVTYKHNGRIVIGCYADGLDMC